VLVNRCFAECNHSIFRKTGIRTEYFVTIVTFGRKWQKYLTWKFEESRIVGVEDEEYA
jgi:hypothetical protein